MKRNFLVFVFFVLSGMLFCSCDSGVVKSESGKLQVSAGMPPVAWIAQQIGADRIQVHSMLPEGRSPHDYTPEPQDIRDAAKSAIIFSCGMPFEENLIKGLRRSKTLLVDASRGVHRLPFADEGHHHHHDGEGHDDHCSRDGLDPHIWLSLENCRVMAENITQELIKADPAGKETFEQNNALLQKAFELEEKRVREKLLRWKGRSFYVYHPAFGYFSELAGLHQEAVELGGREATPAHLAEVIRKARKDQVKVIFVQPQFSPSGMKALAQALGGEVAEMDPLAADILGNIRKMTDILVHGFSQSEGAAERK